MSETKQPIFLVSAYSDPVVVRINGKANYLNCNEFREFIEGMVNEGNKRFVIDFEHCAGMDSTFLGILAGTALELRKSSDGGVLLLCNLSERNHELICNLGLQNLLSIAEDLPEDAAAEDAKDFSVLNNAEVSDARNVLEAHENLVRASDDNVAKFQDVIAFLKNQVEDGGK